MNTLLLTGYASTDTAFAAAAALRTCPDADLRVVSWHQICDVLEGPAFDYDVILLTGLSLLSDTTRAAMALNELREAGRQIHYFTNDAAYYAPAPLPKLMQVHTGLTVTDAVLSHFGIALAELNIFPQKGIRECISACQAHLVETQDDAPYRQCLLAISQEIDFEGWPYSLRQLRRHWLRFAPQQIIGLDTTTEENLLQLLPVWWDEDLAPVPVLLKGEMGTPLRDLAAYFQCPALLPYSCTDCTEASLRQALLHADGAVILLEDIDALPLPAQAVVLRLLKTGRLVIDGANRPVNVRLLATTHKDLTTLTVNGSFLPELQLQLSVYEIVLPPLRERLGFLEAIAEDLCRRRGFAIPSGALETLHDYNFPGNEAELAALLEKASLTTPEAFRAKVAHWRTVAHLSPDTPRQVQTAAEASSLEEAVRQHVHSVLAQCDGNKSQAAARLGITRTTLRKYL